MAAGEPGSTGTQSPVGPGSNPFATTPTTTYDVTTTTTTEAPMNTTTATVTVKGGAVLLHQDVGYFVMLPHSAKGHELRVIGTADCGPVVDFRGEAHIVYTTDLIS